MFTSDTFGLTKLKLQCFNIGKNSILVKVLSDQLVTNIEVYLYWISSAPVQNSTTITTPMYKSCTTQVVCMCKRALLSWKYSPENVSSQPYHFVNLLPILLQWFLFLFSCYFQCTFCVLSSQIFYCDRCKILSILY